MTLDEFRERTRNVPGDTILMSNDSEYGDFIVDKIEVGEVRIEKLFEDGIDFIGDDEKDTVLEGDYKEGSWRAILLDTDLSTLGMIRYLEER